MVPTPGSPLDVINTMMTDPTVAIVAHLAKGPIDKQGDALVLSSLVEADFPGYAPVTLVPNLDDASDTADYGEMGPNRIEFIAGAIVDPQSITHIYYTETIGGGDPSIIGGVAFDVPIVVYKPGQVLPFDAFVNGINFGTD